MTLAKLGQHVNEMMEVAVNIFFKLLMVQFFSLRYNFFSDP